MSIIYNNFIMATFSESVYKDISQDCCIIYEGTEICVPRNLGKTDYVDIIGSEHIVSTKVSRRCEEFAIFLPEQMKIAFKNDTLVTVNSINPLKIRPIGMIIIKPLTENFTLYHSIDKIQHDFTNVEIITKTTRDNTPLMPFHIVDIFDIDGHPADYGHTIGLTPVVRLDDSYQVDFSPIKTCIHNVLYIHNGYVCYATSNYIRKEVY